MWSTRRNEASTIEARRAVLTGQHLGVGAVRNGKQMRWHLGTSLATVHLHHSVSVDGEALVGVDHDAEQARVGLGERGLAGEKDES